MSQQRTREVIDRLLRERTALAPDATLHDLFPVAVVAAEGQALRDWVKRERATRTIEIGLGYGIAALHACEGLLANDDTAARHVAVDPHMTNLGWKVEETSTEDDLHHWTVLRTPEVPPQRPFDHYADF